MPEIALACYHILRAGGLGLGGTNLDAKLRRQSLDPVDLVAAHVGAMKICARWLKAAAAMLDDGGPKAALQDRCAGWNITAGQGMLTSDLGTLFDKAHSGAIAPQPKSGRHEILENYVSRFV